LTSPQFKENMHAYGICYGLCLQGLGHARLNTNLLPRELLTERVIRAKKPWALATAAALMLAFAVNFFFEYNEWYKVHPENEVDGVTWARAKQEVDTAGQTSTDHESRDREKVEKLQEYVSLGQELSGNADRRLLWLELMKAINKALPQDEDVAPNEIPDPTEKPISQRKDLHIEYVESMYFPDLSVWFSPAVKQKHEDELARLESDGAEASDAAEAEVSDADMFADDSGLEESTEAGPSGPGWVIEIKGHHFFNEDVKTWAGTHVRNTLLKNLREQTIELPTGPGKQLETFTMEELGIGYPILAVESRIEKNFKIPNPYYEPPKRPDDRTGSDMEEDALLPRPPAADAAEKAGEDEEKEDNPPFYEAPRYSFIVQFCWRETKLTERLQKRLEQQQQEQPGEPGDDLTPDEDTVALSTTGG
jgi:type IV pilus assembly protein PilM